MVGEKEETGQRLAGRKRRRLVRGWLVGEKEETGQRLAGSFHPFSTSPTESLFPVYLSP